MKAAEDEQQARERPTNRGKGVCKGERRIYNTWAARFVAPSAPSSLHAQMHVCSGGMCMAAGSDGWAELEAEAVEADMATAGEEGGAVCASKPPRAEPPSAPRQFEDTSEGPCVCACECESVGIAICLQCNECGHLSIRLSIWTAGSLREALFCEDFRTPFLSTHTHAHTIARAR